MRNSDRHILFLRTDSMAKSIIRLSVFHIILRIIVVVLIVTHLPEIKNAGLGVITEISRAIAEGQK